MINAIYQIGKRVAGENLDEENFLKNICLKLDKDKTYKQNDGSETKARQHIVIFNFNTETKKIEVDFEEINAGGKNSGNKYLWIGDTIRHRLYCPTTTRRIDRILTETLFQLNEVNGIEEILANNLINEFFKDGKILAEKFDFFEDKINDVKNNVEKLILKIHNCNTKKDLENVAKELKEIWEDAQGGKLKVDTKGEIEDVKNTIELKANEIIEKAKGFLKEKYQKVDLLIKDIIEFKLKFYYLNKLITKSNQVALYTICIDNKIIAQSDIYRTMIYNQKINNSFKDKKYIIDENICPICKTKKIQTTSNFTNLGFKYFMTDKLGFSSNLDGKFINNYNLCKDCYQHLIIAERFIAEELNSSIGGLNVYIIPNLIFPIKNFQIKIFSEYISYKTGKIADLKEIEKKLNDYIIYEDEKNSYIINYLFYQKNKSEFKVLKLIKDIPPTRIDFIRKIEEDISNLIEDKFDDPFNKFKIDFKKIWGCIPIKKKGNTYIGTSKYLDILDNIFSGTPVNYDFLINQAIETIKIIKYETPKFNIRIPKKNDKDYKYYFINKIIQLNFLILFFKKLKLLGETFMEKNKGNIQINELIPKEINEYWNNIGIYNDNPKKGLFLLGYLIGEIGSKQKVKEMKNKPILNKINFQGMGTEKLIRLSSDVLEKLRQNSILEYNDNTFSASHMLIEENICTWKLSNQENVFYILSGYAFSNYLIRKRSKDNYYNELKEKMELIKTMKNENQNVEELEELLKSAKEEAENYKYSNARKILNKIKINKEENKNDK